MDDNNRNLAPLIKMVNDKIEKNINNNFKKYDLTFSQLRIIMLLYYGVGKIYSFKELEKIFNVSQQTMAGLVKRLEMKEFVRIFNDPKDKRVKKVEITQKGREMGESVQKKMIDAENWLASSLTDEEKDVLYQLIKKIYYSIK